MSSMFTALFVVACVGLPPTADAPSSFSKEWSRAVKANDERALGGVVLKIVRDNSEAGYTFLIETGMASDEPWIEAVIERTLPNRMKRGPGFELFCSQATRHKSAAVRLQIVRALAVRPEVEARRAQLTALYDKDPAVILEVVDGLKRRNKLESVPFLLDALAHHEKKKRGATLFAHRIRELLLHFTGEWFETAQEWQGFWKKYGRDFTAPGKRKSTGRVAGGTAVRQAKRKWPQFFGVEIVAQRIVFVLDVSSSMRDTGGEDQTRLSRLKTELNRMIDSLPADTQFTVICFNSTITKLSGSLLKATSSNKSRAKKFFASVEPAAETWTDRALEAAFAVPNVRTIFLMSDGGPVRDTKVIHVPTILSWIEKTNRFRKIPIHCVGFEGTEKSIGHFLREVARLTKGEYRKI